MGRRIRRVRATGSRRRIPLRLYSDVIRHGGNRFTFPLRRTLPLSTEGRKPTLEKSAPAPPVTPDLKIEDVELNIMRNSKDHHTNEYTINETGRDLVVRRGQTFDITVEFNKKYDPETDDLKFVFLAGINPTPSVGTRVTLILSDKDKDKEWGVWILKNEDKKLSVRINTPPTCYVGIWKLQIETVKKVDTKTIVFEYIQDQEIYILFNPWCKDDQVYHPDSSLLDEYILNDTGKIYTGNNRQIHGRKWNFGQFEDDILDCAMYLLDQNISSWSSRGNPILISRKLSAVVNCQDENGVLVGNWSGDYEGGKSPLHWTGCLAILKEYFKTKEPVSFGQCWVFSGLLTTLCRTLGIPARSVTNFASAHDCDGTISIDNFWSKDDEPLEDLNADSVWNFHVWNDVWMARPDLPQGYGGWQAIDATPQECSDYIYQCGPASLEAIKRGEVYLPYDAPFIFAEVNADKIHWKMDANGEAEIIRIIPESVGSRISTKLPIGKPLGRYEYFCFDREREDVTDQYKHREGSKEERTAVIRANQDSTKKGLYHKITESDVVFDLKEKESVPYGHDFEVTLNIGNKSEEIRTISGCICVSSVYYTGVPAAKVKTLRIEEKVEPKKDKEISLKVIFDEYYKSLVDQCHLKMSCMCHVSETKHVYVDQDTFRLLKPDLTIKAPSTGKVGEKIKAEVSFTNPLPCALTNCELTVEGVGLMDTNEIPQSIAPSKSTFMTTVEFIPKKSGTKELLMVFNSSQLEMVDGSCQITISE